MFSFRIYGEPAPQGSKRYVGNGRFIEASAKLKPWRSAIRDAAVLAFSEFAFTEPVIVTVIFVMPKLKTVKRLWPSVAPDLDKLCRALGDGLSVDANIIADDSLIVGWVASKVYGDTPGALVTIRLATEADHASLLDLTQGDETH
jgi:Holliday junction resolvase RusA-like endonuclease